MLRARQSAELLKAPGLAEMAADAVEEGQSVVIFVNFRATLAALQKLMPNLPVIEGETPMDGRADILRRFGADEVRVVAANLATAGEGLDGLQDLRGEFPRLTLISPGFSAVQIKQALGRVHRANAKTKSVQRIVFAAGTVEERACEAVQAKLANMAVLNDGDLEAGMDFRGPASAGRTE
jgi:superfamily II DNA or RNA helicase